MDNAIEHSITLTLNSCEFRGNDVEEMLPDWITERPATVGLSWSPCALGPYSFLIIITISSFLIGTISQSFFNQLGADLYQWLKDKLRTNLAKKNYYNGSLCIEFDDVKIFVEFENRIEHAMEFVKELYPLMRKIVKLKGTNQEICCRKDNQNRWEIKIIKPKHIIPEAELVQNRLAKAGSV